jgi:hypothetical protein
MKRFGFRKFCKKRKNHQVWSLYEGEIPELFHVLRTSHLFKRNTYTKRT